MKPYASSTQFYSDALTYLTVSALFGASLAGQIDFATADNDATAADVPGNLVAAAEISDETIRDIAGAQPLEDRFAGVPEATLIPVVFDADGTEKTPLAIRAPSGPFGVITGSRVNIRSGPSTQYGVVSSGSRGDRFTITGRISGDWVEIRDVGAAGVAWVHGAYFDTAGAL